MSSEVTITPCGGTITVGGSEGGDKSIRLLVLGSPNDPNAQHVYWLGPSEAQILGTALTVMGRQAEHNLRRMR